MQLLKKTYILLMLVILITFAFSGCSKSTQSVGVDLDATAYLVSTIDIGDGAIIEAVSDGDYIYILSSYENQNKLQKISLADNAKTDIDLTCLKGNQMADGIVIDSDGDFLLLVSEWNETGAKTGLIKLSAAGEIISETNLTQLLGLSKNNNVQHLTIGRDDTVYLTVLEISTVSSGTASFIYAINKDMNKVTELPDDNYILDLIIGDENDVYLMYLGESGAGLKKKDLISAMATEVSMPSGINRYNIIGFAAGREEGLLCADGTGLLEIDLLPGTANRILCWADCDVSVDGICYFGQSENGMYWMIKQKGNINDECAMELLTLTETTYGELPAREYITFATGLLGKDVLDAIVNFNKSNGKYHINVKEYFSDADLLDAESKVAAMTRLQMDVTGANPPDLLELHSVNFGQMAAKGALCDLNDLVDQSKIKRGDYLDLTFSSYTSAGKLYGICPGFMFYTLVGHKGKLGDIDRWTIDEIIDWSEQYPDAKLLRGDSADIISLLLGSNYERFVNWEAGECYFDSPEFIRILEFSAGFNGEEDKNINSPDHLGVHEGFSSGKYLLLSDFIYRLDDFYEHDAMFDGEAQYVGYPTEKGSGMLTIPVGAFAIPEGSTNKEGAFAFIEYLLSEEFQNTGKLLDSRFPVKNSAIEEYAERLMVETPGMGKRTPYGFGEDDLMVMIDLEHDEEYLELLMEMISRVDGIKTSDEQILMIINEEAAGFLAGQKSAAEVAEIIQNRVQVYVNENR